MLHHVSILEAARHLATEIASLRPSREVDADDVYAALIHFGYDPDELGNAAGALFRGLPQWEFTGKWRQSRRASNHARYIRVWRLREAAEVIADERLKELFATIRKTA